VAALGMATMMVLGSPVAIFAGMVLFGAGFGVIENATFAQLARLARGWCALARVECCR
jgi:hypothetical protein